MTNTIAHQPAIEVEATSVGARWKMQCPAGDAVTPLMSKQGAELAKERHEWETER